MDELDVSLAADADQISQPKGHVSMRLLFPFAKRFIAGQTLAAALPKARQLVAKGFRTTLDHLGENVTDRTAVDGAVQDYLLLLQACAAAQIECNISIKLTQIGLDIDQGLCRDHLLRIVAEARRLNGFVRVDMEGSAYTERTIALVKDVHRALPNVGTVIQSMLRRSPQDVEDLLAAGISIRLVKGAYKEPATIAFADKHAVDAQCAVLMERLLTSRIYCAIATHDAQLIERAKTIVKSHGLTPSDFEFQMLLGIRESLQTQLVADGWRMRIYMPYGSAWLPYVIRRMRERKENFWFVMKNVFRK